MDRWWEWPPGWIGLVAGAFGAWRAWTTERNVVRTRAKWELEAGDLDTTNLRSLLPYRARDVAVDGGDMWLHDADASERTRVVHRAYVEPRGMIRLVVLRPHMRRDTTLTVRWRRRWGWTVHTEPVTLPEHGAARPLP